MTEDKFYDIIIYHGGCADGFSSAQLALNYHEENKKECKLLPFDNGKPQIAEIKDSRILIVDNFPSNELINRLLEAGNVLSVIDHHISNEERINEYKAKSSLLHAVFSLDKCATELTFEYFYPEKDKPKFIQHISDRDLWKWTDEDSKAITTAAFSRNCFYKRNMWLKLFDTEFLKECKEWGNLELKINNDIIDTYIKYAKRYIFAIDGKKYKTWGIGFVINKFRSELCSKLCENENVDFSFAHEFQDDGKIRISMRAITDNLDLSTIAKKFENGGGHPRASGFTINKLSDVFVEVESFE